MGKLKAPYNFIPYNGTILEETRPLPPHNQLDDTLLTGKIHITLEADTPVFVSDGQKDNPHFFKGANGAYQIPGSTLRGMVRKNMAVLGFGVVRVGEDLEDYQIYFRKMATKNDTVWKTLQEYYNKTALGVDTKTVAKAGQRASNISVPRNVKAGYVTCRHGAYYLTPCQFYRVPPHHSDLLAHQSDTMCTYPATFSLAQEKVQRIDFSCNMGQEGTLLFSGKAVGKPNAKYIFGETTQEEIPLTPEDVTSYKMDVDGRATILKPEIVSFLALPSEGERKAFFFINHEDHIYLGRTYFLRIGHKHPISHGLIETQSNKQSHLDYLYSMLGYVDTQEVSYRSRVSFGDCTAVGYPQELPPIKLALMGPKVSCYASYITKRTQGDLLLPHYSSDAFSLRGQKRYWLKNPDLKNHTANDNANVGTTLCPLDKGTRFTGTVSFSNLREDELGLLLWALRLEDGCYQSIGQGKPYGYGRMKLTIQDVYTEDFSKLYSLDGLGGHIEKACVDDYIQAYQAYVHPRMPPSKKPKPAIKQPIIEDLLYFQSTIRNSEDVAYLPLEDFKNISTTLETVRDIRKPQ